MTSLVGYIDGIGLLGPGIDGWPAGRAILAGAQSYEFHKTVLPAPALLPAAERRRSGPIVKLSIAVGVEAATAAGRELSQLSTVFSASGGDGGNCHEICQMLATEDRQISPTRFHNSVHNAAAGYWSIAAGAMASSSVLCAYDASFGAGLLEALAQVAIDGTESLLIACDTVYPEPLSAARPILDDMGVGLLLAPRRSERSIARIAVELVSGPADHMADAALERLRTGVPAARSLPLLQAIARGTDTTVSLDYLEARRLAVQVSSCLASPA